MDYAFLDTNPVFQILISAVLGAFIGLERELARKDASLRTFSLICIGSCMFAIMSAYSARGIPNAEPSRIAAHILPGIGFIGAGAIFKSSTGVSGLTTAALIWVTAGIGMAVGFNRIDIAIGGTCTALVVIFMLQLVHALIRAVRPGHYPEDSSSDVDD